MVPTGVTLGLLRGSMVWGLSLFDASLMTKLLARSI